MVSPWYGCSGSRSKPFSVPWPSQAARNLLVLNRDAGTADSSGREIPVLCRKRGGCVVTTQKESSISPLIQSFFTQHLRQHRRVSPQTVASYRDTLKLLLQFVKEQHGKEPSALCVADLDAPVILSFLDHLEEHRNNSARSRNVRLAAIRTFFRWIALRDPTNVGLATRVMAIPQKRTDKKLVQALSRTEMEAILAAPDLSSWRGRRDHAILLTMYNSGARVSEIISIQRGQVNFGATTFLQLHGKGRKERAVPLWTKTSRALQAWFREL